MFFRLLLAFLSMAIASAVLTAWLLARKLNISNATGFLTESLSILLVVTGVAFALGLLLARRFVRPILAITEAANRIAAGDYGHRIHGGVWGESRSLARTFNAMSKRLAQQFQQLEADREQLLAILGGMVEGVVAVDPEQRVLFANEAAGRMLDFDPEGMVGRHFWEVGRQPTIQNVIKKALHGPDPHREELDLKGPIARNLTLYVAPLAGEPAGQHGAVLVVQDTTELRRLERMRQDFVANVSHELKTPLSVIKACVEALIDGAVDDPEARRPFLDQVADQGERLHALILDLLSLARIESGEEMLDFEALSLHEMIDECIERHRPRAEGRSISITALPPTPDSLLVWADEEAFGQILDNLVDNAVKYTQPGGSVRVRWHAADDNICLEVEDTGNGIPERDLPRIFERFYRVDKARSRELGGTGLGLAIVKHLVQAMKGSVRAASIVGKGTTFTVTLPKPPGEI